MNCEKDDLMSSFYRAMHLLGRSMYMNRGPQQMMHRGQGKLLVLLKEMQPVTQKDLVEALDIRPSSLSELLKKLEEKGLVARKHDEEDKRNIIVSLTTEGEKAVEKQKEDSFSSNLFDTLNEEEQQQFKTLLNKLTDAWEKEFGNKAGHCGPHPGFGGRGMRHGFPPRHRAFTVGYYTRCGGDFEW